LYHLSGPLFTTPFPYTTLFRSLRTTAVGRRGHGGRPAPHALPARPFQILAHHHGPGPGALQGEDVEQLAVRVADIGPAGRRLARSEEHTSELQSRENLVCRLLL